MLIRQRVVVEMLAFAKRPASKIELMKWAFLLKSSMPTRGGPAFYDFVPYHYGPFSFCLSREIAELVRQGILIETETSWTLGHDDFERQANIPEKVTVDLQKIIDRFSSQPLRNLIDHVYLTYPLFTVNSKLECRTSKLTARCAIYTAGYEGMSVDRFLELLIRSGIQRLIDVRNNPISRRYGFHKSTLERLCGYLDLQYEHFPDLGIRPKFRRFLETPSDYDVLFGEYVETTLPANMDAVRRVTELVKERPSVLVCMESDPLMCHRSRLAQRISRDVELPVIHLEAADE